jgi:hypothetical protein
MYLQRTQLPHDSPMNIIMVQRPQFSFTNQMANINYIWILKAYLRHVSVQVFHLQGEQNASFKTNCRWPAVIYKVLQCGVATLLKSINKKLQIVQVFKNLWLNYHYNISYTIKYDTHEVKLLLWCLVVETSNYVATYVPVSNAYIRPKRIGSARVCVCVCVCVRACVWCIGAIQL